MTKRTDREAMAAAREVLEPHGFDLSLSHTGKHPAIIAYRAGRTYRIPICNTPRVRGVEGNYTRQTARAILRGAYSPVSA